MPQFAQFAMAYQQPYAIQPPMQFPAQPIPMQVPAQPLQVPAQPPSLQAPVQPLPIQVPVSSPAPMDLSGLAPSLPVPVSVEGPVDLSGRAGHHPAPPAVPVSVINGSGKCLRPQVGYFIVQISVYLSEVFCAVSCFASAKCFFLFQVPSAPGVHPVWPAPMVDEPGDQAVPPVDKNVPEDRLPEDE